ncbi:hypothetical protein S100390_v1c01160 [Spiroplasma sp. NBRC 100390]|uniref:hypothetical protein n=1 Tax=unclassified Spiroplasma TaxID=2637901 RepID=UPI0008928152|nr:MULTISPECIES: hypothetical protein [unclassified Spiroplasma]AOX43459.1 hypothetical protein STU14_v1c01160 [Spiroplasma sp. TU-14]APE12929.1 hypothetical protein S100390_v1c01160 [Spiroplasma sp. NBRC 100390]
MSTNKLTTTSTLSQQKKYTVENQKILNELLAMRLNTPTIERLLLFKKGLTQDQKQLLLSITKNLTPEQTLISSKAKKKTPNSKINNKEEEIVAIKRQHVKHPSQLEYINEHKHKRITQKIKKTNYAGRTIPKQENIYQIPIKKEIKRTVKNETSKTKKTSLEKKEIKIEQPVNNKKYQITKNSPFFDYDPGYVRQYSRATLWSLAKTNYKTWNKVK